ncbi:MAG: class I SAM-dependent methyltransferase [Candidatus Bathyarchaeota archaeon]|nr:class I SAM-dependent methyltransferase [Candidatus Bathyarchaeota archaeon]
MTSDDKLVEYYSKRAGEYEEIYDWEDPDRQREQDLLSTAIRDSLRGRDVLEVACGTGWWTRILSESAKSIMATDLGDEVLDIAREKKYGCHVTFKREDAYNLSFEDDSFNGGLAFSWFSHIPHDLIDRFIDEFHRVLERGSRVFIADNAYIQGIGGEPVGKEGDPNTYKIRSLKDGGVFTIVKNYFSVEDLVEIFGRHVEGFSENNVMHGECFWYVDYVL